MRFFSFKDNLFNLYNPNMENCALCGRLMSLGDMFTVSDGGKKTYECKDEVACNALKAEYRKQKAAREKADMSASFREKYGICVEDLTELTPRMRDASVHYYDPVGDRVFTQALWQPDGDMSVNTSVQLRAIYKLPTKVKDE
jgi:hypothetical protein